MQGIGVYFFNLLNYLENRYIFGKNQPWRRIRRTKEGKLRLFSGEGKNMNTGLLHINGNNCALFNIGTESIDSLEDRLNEFFGSGIHRP
ncbi:MAG: hypothetical protein LBQ46_05760 [Treponema sp.]|nr:hypothetical protein [Treponema sp.]